MFYYAAPKALPRIFAHSNYQAHLAGVADEYAGKADFLADAFADIDGLTLVKPQGAYMLRRLLMLVSYEMTRLYQSRMKRCVLTLKK